MKQKEVKLIFGNDLCLFFFGFKFLFSYKSIKEGKKPKENLLKLFLLVYFGEKNFKWKKEWKWEKKRKKKKPKK